MGDHRDQSLLEVLHEVQCDRVLDGQEESARHEDEGQRPVGRDGQIGVVGTGLELGDVARARHGQAGHDTKLERLAEALKGRVVAEAHVVQRVLEPREPDDGEETDVRPQG